MALIPQLVVAEPRERDELSARAEVAITNGNAVNAYTVTVRSGYVGRNPPLDGDVTSFWKLFWRDSWVRLEDHPARRADQARLGYTTDTEGKAKRRGTVALVKSQDVRHLYLEFRVPKVVASRCGVYPFVVEIAQDGNDPQASNPPAIQGYLRVRAFDGEFDAVITQINGGKIETFPRPGQANLRMLTLGDTRPHEVWIKITNRSNDWLFVEVENQHPSFDPDEDQDDSMVADDNQLRVVVPQEQIAVPPPDLKMKEATRYIPVTIAYPRQAPNVPAKPIPLNLILHRWEGPAVPVDPNDRATELSGPSDKLLLSTTHEVRRRRKVPPWLAKFLGRMASQKEILFAGIVYLFALSVLVVGATALVNRFSRPKVQILWTDTDQARNYHILLKADNGYLIGGTFAGLSDARFYAEEVLPDNQPSGKIEPVSEGRVSSGKPVWAKKNELTRGDLAALRQDQNFVMLDLKGKEYQDRRWRFYIRRGGIFTLVADMMDETPLFTEYPDKPEKNTNIISVGRPVLKQKRDLAVDWENATKRDFRLVVRDNSGTPFDDRDMPRALRFGVDSTPFELEILENGLKLRTKLSLPESIRDGTEVLFVPPGSGDAATAKAEKFDLKVPPRPLPTPTPTPAVPVDEKGNPIPAEDPLQPDEGQPPGSGEQSGQPGDGADELGSSDGGGESGPTPLGPATDNLAGLPPVEQVSFLLRSGKLSGLERAFKVVTTEIEKNTSDPLLLAAYHYLRQRVAGEEGSGMDENARNRAFEALEIAPEGAPSREASKIFEAADYYYRMNRGEENEAELLLAEFRKKYPNPRDRKLVEDVEDDLPAQ